MKKLIADFDVRERAAAIAAVLLVWLVANLVFVFLVNIPRSQRAAALDQEVMLLASKLSTEEREVSQLRAHYDRVMEGRSSLDKFYSDVLSTKQERLINFQKEIREIANKFHISVETIAYPREEYPKDKVTKFSATMPLSGSYESLREFIDTIEKSDNFIVIEEIQLANSKEGGVILSLSIRLSTYFVDPEIREKAADAPKERRG